MAGMFGGGMSTARGGGVVARLEEAQQLYSAACTDLGVNVQVWQSTA